MSAPATGNDLRDLLRVLAMPFQLASLIFVALTSLLLSVFLGGDLIRLVVSLLAIFVLMVWITHYALALIDDAANGVREIQTASVEMATFFADARGWIHPFIAVVIGTLLHLHPEWSRLPVLAAAALLFPASLGACAMSGHALDALNPAAMARLISGLGPWYLVTVLFMLACAAAGVVIVRTVDSLLVVIAAIQMLLLLAYAWMGGVLYMRRGELDFEPRRSPEKAAMDAEATRRADRQQIIDGLYADLRVRESRRALDKATAWLRGVPAGQLHGDVHALLTSGTGWTEPREYPKLLRGLVPMLLDMRQPALALALAEAALAVAPEFSVEGEAQTSALVSYALQTGRRRMAARLLDNFLARDGSVRPGPSLQALRERLQPGEPR